MWPFEAEVRLAGIRCARALTRLLIPVALLALGAACGGGGASRTATARPGSPVASASAGTAGPVDGTAVVPSPGPDEYPPPNPNITPVIAADTIATHAAIAWQGPLAPVSTDGSFEISVPKNWRAEQREGQDFLALAYRDDTGVFASLHIQCSRGATVGQLIEQDRTNIFGLQLGYRVQFPRPATIAGQEFQEVRWTGGFTGLATDNMDFYLPGDGCAWRLQFSAYHGLRIRDHRADIEAILATFKAK